MSIKPILNFNDEGKIVVFEKVRKEKKAVKRLVALAEENREMELSILHTNAPEKAEDFKKQLEAQGIRVSAGFFNHIFYHTEEVPCVPSTAFGRFLPESHAAKLSVPAQHLF